MSKGLEALERIKDNLTAIHSQFPHEECPNLVDYVRKVYGIDIIEKELKALALIKEKRVNLEYLECCDTYEQYKTMCSYWNVITQEEYDLLKEVLKYD